MYEDGEKLFKPSMEKIKNNLEGKEYIAVVTDAIEANANIIRLNMIGCQK